MMFRKVAIFLAFSLAFFLSPLRAQYLVTFQGPASVSQDPTVSFYDATTLALSAIGSVNGAFQFLSLPDGSQVYLIANVTGPAITAFQVPKHQPVKEQRIGNFANPVNCGALSPDGTRLVVGENAVYIFDTSTNTDLTPNGIVVGGGATIVAIAVSYDSQTAYALATYNGAGFLSAINIAQATVTNTLNIAGTATAVALGPNGLLYVSAPNQILEINPATLVATPGGVTTLEATTPGKLVFTPDGNYALAANQVFGTGPAVLLLNLNDHAIEGIVPFTGLAALASSPLTGLPAPFDNLDVASSNVAYALSSGSGALYSLQLGVNGGLILNTPNIPNITVAAQSAVALSNDLGVPGRNYPQALYLVSNGSLDGTGIDNLYRIDPATSLLTQQVPLYSTPGAVAYYAPTLTFNSPVSVLEYGNNQNLLPGATSLPLVIRVLDQNGLPVSGVGVNFNAGAGSINPVNTATGSDGYAQAIFTAGSTPADIGPISIIATADTVQAAFTVNVGTGLTATPAALTVVSGQGQIISEDPSMNTPPGIPAPFTILATDDNGNPLPNALVTFTVASGNGALLAPDGSSQSSLVAPTDYSGQAYMTFVPPFVTEYRGFESATVTASAMGDSGMTVSQNFYIATVQLDVEYCGTPPCTPPLIPIYLQVLQPAPGTVLTGPAGSVLPGAVQVSVISETGLPMPNVGVQVSTGPNSNVPNASCANAGGGGLALTNASGSASCDVLLNGVAGSLPLTVSLPVVGAGALSYGGYTLTITPGAPATISIVSGNNQSVPTATFLPQPMVIKVTDANNNPVATTPLTWTVLSGFMNLTNVGTSTNGAGEASSGGFVTSSGGSTVTVQVTAGSASATFTINVSVPAATIAIVSGNNQSAQINTPFTNPLVVQLLDKNGNPASFSSVGFAANGVATITPTIAVADATGQATATIVAGPISGPLNVTAAYGAGKSAITVTFNLTVLPLGPVGPSILNAASFAPGIAPGGLVTFLGLGLTPTIQGVVTDPAQMAGYSVSFGGITAPLLALVNQNGVEQINAQVPFEVSPGGNNISIQTPLGSSLFSNVQVDPLSPGVFTNGTLSANGQTYPLATAVRSDGSYVSAANPVQRGETITFFATGLGQTAPNASTGVLGVPGQIVASALFAGVNNQGDAVVSAIYQPNALGVYAVAIQIPANTLPGPAQPLILELLDSTGTGYTAPLTYVPIR